MDEKPSKLSLPCLLLAQAQVAFNDNAARFMLVGLAQAVLPAEKATIIVSALAAILIAPFVALAPVVGWVADRFPKQKVLKYALLLQVAVMLWIVAAIAAQQLILAVIGFALLSIQACFFSPAKQGILKELVGADRLGVATGWMVGLSTLSILLGIICGGFGFDHFAGEAGDPWKGALKGAWILTAGATAAFLIFLGVRRTEPQSSERFHSSILLSHFTYVAELWRARSLRLAALGIAYFWAFGGVVNLSVIQLGRDLHRGEIGSMTDSSILLFIIGSGMVAGALVAGAFSRRRIELGIVPFGAAGLVIAIICAGVAPVGSAFFKTSLVALGFAAGLFTIPLNAYLQAKAEDSRRGRVLAALTLLVDAGGLLAIGAQYGLAQWLDLTAPQQFLVMALPSTAVAVFVVWLLPEHVLRLTGVSIARCIYRVRSIGQDNVPKTGAVLIICNHVTYVDSVILQIACPREIRFVAYEGFHKSKWLGWFLRIMQVIPISPKHAREAIRSVAEYLKRGEVVCVFPEGQLTRTGTLQGLRKGFELMARQAGAPVIPVFLDSLWDSIFAYSDRKFFWKMPKRWPYGTLVNFGKPIAADQADAVSAWQDLLDLGEDAFQRRPELREHLGLASIRKLSRLPWKTLIVDRTGKRREMSRGVFLGLALALSRRWKKSIPGRRVGVVLPPGIAGSAANLALVLVNKVPVNLNFTAGRAALESCLARGEVDTVLTADALRRKAADFPWPTTTLDIGAEIAACGKAAVLAWACLAAVLPAGLMIRLLGLPARGDQEEAALLFTSGSSGEPKGVVLSHRNILGNVMQFAGTNIISRSDRILGCLPLFHSFGFTVTHWYPMVRGLCMVTVPSPLEAAKIGEAVSEEGVTILLSTPTFLRSYHRKIDADKFRSLRFAVAGAEKLPSGFAESFRQKFGIPVVEGYGLTETSPVLSVNIPNPELDDHDGIAGGARQGSVGRLLPGITARIVDPDTGAERSPLETGLLKVRGPNIFSGYLKDPERTRSVLADGWFKTGDIARFDQDGFLFIEGRLSRFSKIGGEMVPHGTVEEKIAAAFGLEHGDQPGAVVVGVPDESKGEALVLLTTADLRPDQLREKLSAAGLPNLWIPKSVIRIEKMPVLGTGKLNLRACQQLALESRNSEPRTQNPES